MDEGIFERNLEAYEKRFGKFEDKSSDKATKYSVDFAKDGSKILVINENDDKIYMNSTYDPAYEALAWTKRYDNLSNISNLFVMEGLSDGYFFRAMRYRMSPQSYFIVYEPSESLFSFVMHEFNISDILEEPRFVLVLPSMGNDHLLELLTTYTENADRNTICTVLPGYSIDSNFEKVYKQASIENEANSGYHKYMGKTSVKNELYALSKLDKNYLIYDYANAFPKECPVILVAAGPSLLDNVKELSKAKSRALIVAVDRAAKVLIENGIEPDFVATVDPSKSADYIKFKGDENIYLLGTYTANKEALIEYTGRTFYIHPDVSYKEIPGHTNRIFFVGDAGGSVATCVFTCFAKMGVDTIILVGQDLAMKNGKTHASISDEINMSEYYEIDGLNGDKVLTRWDWDRFRLFYERKIREFKDLNVVDATEGGALINGSKVMTLNDAIDEYCQKNYDISGIISKMPHGQTEEEHKETVKLMQERIDELNEIKDISHELSKVCHKLANVCKYGDIREKKNHKDIFKVDELKDKIRSKKINDTLEGYWVAETSLIPQRVFVVRNNDEAYPVYRDAEKYYNLLPDACDALIKEIQEAFDIKEEKEEKL